MAFPSDASVVVLWGSWFDESTRAGMSATLTATPLPAGSTSSANTPNLTDIANFAWIKSRTWTTTPLDSGLFALPLIANDDPDLTAFGGYRISPQGETPFIVNVSVTSPTVTVTQDLADAIARCASQSGSTFSIPAGSTVQAVHLTEAAVLSQPAPSPPSAYLTAAQTNSVIASALASYQGGGGSSSLVPTSVFTTGSHTPTTGEMALYNPSSNLTVTLPVAAAGQRFGVSNVSAGTNTVTFNRAGSDTFTNGATSLVLGAGERAVLIGKSGGFTLESRTHTAALVQWAGNPDALIVGTITRNTDGAATSAGVVWPDGTAGTYTATTLSSSFPGAVDAYTVTYGSPATKTYTQPAVTRNASGAVTARPAVQVS